MAPLARLIYLTAAGAFLLAWAPILVASRRNQPKRLAYLVPVVLYLFMQAILGWASYSDPLDNPVELWSGGHGGRHSWLGFPAGIGVPLCLGVLTWDWLRSLRQLRPPLTDAQLQERISQELSAQAGEQSRKDYW